MTDKIEKMARAMATITHISPDTKQAAFMGSGSIPLGYGPEYWRTFVPFCHAALEALREPTPEMIQAGWLPASSSSDANHDEIKAAYKAMIDQARGK